MAIVHLGNNEGKLEGFPADILNKVSDECSFPVKGAEKSELFRKHRWDGRKRLFNKQSGKFPMGLWDRIRQIVDTNTPYGVDDKRTGVRSATDVTLSDDVEARPYQDDAVRAAILNGRSILQVATGGGKTVIASKLIASLKCNTLFLVHTKDLLYQAKGSFEEMLVGQEIGQIGDGVVDIRPITVATMQSLSKHLGIKFEKGLDDASYDEEPIDGTKHAKNIDKCVRNTDLVIWDEVHRVACDMALGVAQKIVNAPYWVGLSASPWRDDGADLMIEAAIGSVKYKLDASALIDMGYLVPPIIRRVKIPASIPWHYDTRSYDQIYRDEIVNNEYRNKVILKYAADFMELNIPSLILIQQIKHGKILQKMISGEYHPIDFLSGRDLSYTRNNTIQGMRDGKVLSLIASTIADEGLDIKRLTGLIMAGGGKSSTRALQRIGRVLRPFEGKTHALVIDFDDEALYLKDHASKRREIYLTEPRFTILEI